MATSRQSQLLWNFIVAYKQATGRQLSYVNLNRDRAALQQALTQASQLRDQALQRVIEELEANLPEAKIVAKAARSSTSIADNVHTVTEQPITTTKSDAIKQQGYVDIIAAFLGSGTITLERRCRLDEYCLEHGLAWAKAEALERVWRAAHNKNALSWRDEFRRGVAALQNNGSITENNRLRLYHTYIRRERLTIAEAESAAASAVTQQNQSITKWFYNPVWIGSLAVTAGVVIALVLGLPWIAPVRDAALSFATAQRGGTDMKIPQPIPLNLSPMLRIHGSNTLGAHLTPTLAEAYLNQLGSASVQRMDGAKEDETNIYGFTATSSYLIDLKAHGSATAFTSLEAGSADLGAASRPINSKEILNLQALGDMTSSACEHVIGLDGVAIIVHPSNPLIALSKSQIATIFSGEVKDWRAFGGTPGPIHLYSRDDKSGTHDTFTNLVMGKLKIDAGAKLYESNDALSSQVASDPSAIGFVALPAVRDSKALAISDGGPAILPTRFTIATEDYPLSRRLFLYSPAKPTKAAQEFLNLTLADAGQIMLAKEGFVDLRPEVQSGARDPSSPHHYLELTANAQRLSLNFRFHPDNKSLDNKAQRDLDRLVTYFGQANNTNKRIILLGFSDNSGTKAKDQKVSEDDAKTVADAMQMRGIYPSTVAGFGSALPLADNSNPVGRVKNRRVEIWVLTALSDLAKFTH